MLMLSVDVWNPSPPTAGAVEAVLCIFSSLSSDVAVADVTTVSSQVAAVAGGADQCACIIESMEVMRRLYILPPFSG